MSKVEINGVSIAYEVKGTGFPLIFSHEFAGDMVSWERQVEYFSRNYRVITFNTVGYSPSDVPDDLTLYEYDYQISYIKGILDHLAIDSAHVAGLSMGSQAALGFGIKYPHITKSLVIAGAGTGTTNTSAFKVDAEKRALILETEGMNGLRDYTNGTTRSRFLQRDPEAWQRFADGFLAHSSKGSANTLRGYQARRPSLYDLKDELVKLNVPTLIIVGDEDDPCIQPALFMKEAIPRSGLLMMPQTGHAVNIERPEEFNSALDHFYAEVFNGGWSLFDPGSGDAWRV